jgi:hypothetical protein
LLPHPLGLHSGLLKNTHNLRLQFREFHRQHRAPRMEDQIAALGKQFHMATDRCSHPPLQPVALVRLAHHLARGQAHARTFRQRSA